jgi:hypothetical protein
MSATARNLPLLSRTPGPPSFASMKTTPAFSSARCIASTVLGLTESPRQHPRHLAIRRAGRRRPRAPLCLRRIADVSSRRTLSAVSARRFSSASDAAASAFFRHKENPAGGGAKFGRKRPNRTNDLCVAQVDGRIVTGPIVPALRWRRYLSRASSCATLPACHSPTPREVRMPRRFNSAAMARRLRAPPACMSATVGASTSARAWSGLQGATPPQPDQGLYAWDRGSRLHMPPREHVGGHPRLANNDTRSRP